MTRDLVDRVRRHGVCGRNYLHINYTNQNINEEIRNIIGIIIILFDY
jgi:hypothetical protein